MTSRTGHDAQAAGEQVTFLTKWGDPIGEGQFISPEGIAVDALGNVYVTDIYTYNHIQPDNRAVQKFSSSGTFLASYPEGPRGSGDGQFDTPTGIAVDGSGNIYVADYGNNRVQKFNADLAILTKWGTAGTGDGQFSRPTGIAVDSSGNVYVTDQYNGRVQKFDSNGKFLTKWGTTRSGDANPSKPWGIAVDNYGNVYVTDGRVQKFTSDGTFLAKWGSPNDQSFSPNGIAIDSSGNVYVTHTANYPSGAFTSPPVKKFTASGALLTEWGTAGTGGGQFVLPRGIAVDNAGYVYVADSITHRVQKFSSSGTFLAEWGSPKDGQFRDAEGIAVDPAGDVYVIDDFSDRVQKFSSSGTFLAEWGTAGTGGGQFVLPRGIAVDNAGNVYVTDAGNYRVQKFTSDGTFLTTWGTFGRGDGQFYSPFSFSIAVDAWGNIYVGDSANSRVQKFGVSPPATAISCISGTVWVDTDRNGARDAGETDYEGATITLSGPVSGTTTTNASGNYSFTNLSAGSYTVSLDVPVGFTATTTNPVNVVIGPSTTVNFGIAPISAELFAIEGKVWVDIGRNEVKDPKESDYPGATVTLSTPVSVVNGEFETGDLTGWTASGINGGTAFVVQEGTCFSANNTLGLTLNGDFAANVRSSAPGSPNEIGILTSDPFVAGSSITFMGLSENDPAAPVPNPVTLTVMVLDGVGNVLISQVVQTNVVTLNTGFTHDCLGDPVDGVFSTHTIDTSALSGQTVQLQFQQHTNVAGKGFFTLIDDVTLSGDGSRVCGDQNGDMVVNIFDIVVYLRIAMGVGGPGQGVLNDLNGDGAVNIFDAIMALKHTVGIVPSLNECSSRTKTDESGNYAFTGVPAGNYKVILAMPSGYTKSTTNPVRVTIGPSITVNFGIAPTCGERIVIFMRGIIHPFDPELVDTLTAKKWTQDKAFAAIADWLKSNDFQEKLGYRYEEKDFRWYSYNPEWSKDIQGQDPDNGEFTGRDWQRPLGVSAASLDRQVVFWADQCADSRFDIIAHSLGGAVAAAAANTFGDRFLLPLHSIITLESPLGGIPVGYCAVGSEPFDLLLILFGEAANSLCFEKDSLKEGLEKVNFLAVNHGSDPIVHGCAQGMTKGDGLTISTLQGRLWDSFDMGEPIFRPEFPFIPCLEELVAEFLGLGFHEIPLLGPTAVNPDVKQCGGLGCWDLIDQGLTVDFFDDRNPTQLQYSGNWEERPDDSHIRSTIKASSEADALVTFSIPEGALKVVWITSRGLLQGKAQVFVCGEFQEDVTLGPDLTDVRFEKEYSVPATCAQRSLEIKVVPLLATDPVKITGEVQVDGFEVWYR